MFPLWINSSVAGLWIRQLDDFRGRQGAVIDSDLVDHTPLYKRPVTSVLRPMLTLYVVVATRKILIDGPPGTVIVFNCSGPNALACRSGRCARRAPRSEHQTHTQRGRAMKTRTREPDDPRWCSGCY